MERHEVRVKWRRHEDRRSGRDRTASDICARFHASVALGEVNPPFTVVVVLLPGDSFAEGDDVSTL